MSGPGAGGVQTASAVLGDVVSILSGEAPVHETRGTLAMVTDVESAFYLHLEVADRPGVLAQIASVLGEHEVSVKSVNQRGVGNDARLVMVMHQCPESSFRSAGTQLTCAPPTNGRTGVSREWRCNTSSIVASYGEPMP